MNTELLKKIESRCVEVGDCLEWQGDGLEAIPFYYVLNFIYENSFFVKIIYYTTIYTIIFSYITKIII
jgi:hypothetical protein